MKRTALILALAVVIPGWAQDKPAAQESAKPAAQESATAEAPKPQAPKKSAAKTHSRRFEDARHCLDKPTNEEIIKCAEAYL